MRLEPIPQEKYEEYRRDVIFDCYKWDPQFLDHNTIARYALIITEKEHEELRNYTQALDAETRAAEQLINRNLKLAGPLKLPQNIKRDIRRMRNYNPDKHIRLMRYDFHPTMQGKWVISEVNSDVPGGFAESSLMPEAARERLTGDLYYESFGENLVKAIKKKVPAGGRIMMVHCTCFSDDRQVMQYLGDRLVLAGYKIIYAASDHLEFKEGQAISRLDGNEGPIDGIVRFSPLEWLTDVRPKRWHGYFDTQTPSCNHPIAIFAQTKRFPFVWDLMEANGLSMETWRELLPETLDVKRAKGKDGFIYKPVYGRVGEDISIKEACKDDEYSKIMKAVKRHPSRFLAQKRFDSKPLNGINKEQYHVCIGSYAVDGKHAGYYARISATPRIDSNAADIPVLIERGGCKE